MRHDVPVVMVTAKGQEHERVQGLQHGADDYVTKPFSLRELELRVRSVLRRASARRPRSSTSCATATSRSTSAPGR